MPLFKSKKKKRTDMNRSLKLDRQRSSIFKVNMKRGEQGARKRLRLVIIVAAVILCVGITGILFWTGLHAVGRFLLWNNDLFRVREIKIECDGDVITRKHIVDYAELDECTNLFSVNIGAMRRHLLETVPRLKNVDISRELPGKLIIRVQERISAAKLQMKGYYLAVDLDGHVLGPVSPLKQLPVIAGHCMPGLKPGVLVSGTSIMDALQVIDVCNTSPVGEIVKIAWIDVRDRNVLELHLIDGTEVSLAWQYMGTENSLSREMLDRKMIKLANNIKSASENGRQLKSFDMTYDDNFPAIKK